MGPRVTSKVGRVGPLQGLRADRLWDKEIIRRSVTWVGLSGLHLADRGLFRHDGVWNGRGLFCRKLAGQSAGFKLRESEWKVIVKLNLPNFSSEKDASAAGDQWNRTDGEVSALRGVAILL